ncbi:hypothetical protein IEN85_03365 [Pelagicoccus sp. NFK12]|uniref:TonB-dependent receptor plug domain-containing protein n=1 Tax=Pelagicoccus enzymogenes TaxID=2773457 RepID=A0A927F7T5_9BACT|nr:TonB-dependent receptor plug domain-containing protein [Pelagicoccus enzymogenes]MBD5778518.1 hypothetical protein [Pelagicoccus enzymogenes]MDQ8197121.1 hypothetical protein [Pelagicoccus enzymogenes]
MLTHKNYPSKVGPFSAALLAASILVSGSSSAQESDEEEELYELSPFTVEGDSDQGYRATSTLAGTRFRTDLSDIGSSISVLTEEFLQDVGGTDNETVLAYATNTEVGGARGNYSGGVSGGSVAREQDLFGNPNGNTRVRGLNSADNTRNYFSTDVPWDGYTVKRVDLLRGPNSILFGLGSPSGVVNATTTSASISGNEGSVGLSLDDFGSIRASVDYNKVLIENELAFYVAALREDRKFQQKPAYEEDNRMFIATKYAPKAFNGDGTSFDVNLSFENGSITSNRPRILTPADLITPFWTPASRTSEDNNTVYTAETYPGYPGGIGKRTVNHFTEDPFFDGLSDGNTFSGAAVGQFMNGPQFQFNSLAGPAVNTGTIGNKYGAYDSAGNIVGHGPLPTGVTAEIWGDNSRRKGIDSTSNWANYTGQYGASGGFWENQAISDPTIFDFYNKLLDGPNKREMTDWDVVEASVSHTFLDGKLGYNLSFFDQKLSRGQYGIFGWESRIGIDINEQLEWGSPVDPNDPETVNPNIGRAYVQEVLHSTGNNVNDSNRNAFRGQVFANYDFEDKNDNIFARILGSHTFTGLYADESNYRESRSLNLAQISAADHDRYGSLGDPSFRYYLSDDLRGRSSAAGINLSGVDEYVLPSSGPITVRMFDSTWAATGVDPLSEWNEPRNRNDDGTLPQQRQNPANYVGWTDKTVNLISLVDSDGNMIGPGPDRDYLTSNARMSDFGVKSEVFVWQGKFFNDSVIGLYGYRTDKSTSTLLDAPAADVPDQQPNRDDVSPSVFNLNNPDASTYDLDTDTTNWSVSVHLNRLLGDPDYLPFKFSMYYNEGENFQPAAGRLDAFERPLPPPAGNTEEYSVLLETKDGKYSLRATEYKTVVSNQNTTGDIGAMWALQQSLYAPTESLARFNSGAWNTDVHPDPDYLRNTIIPAWEQFVEDLSTEFPLFEDAWVSNGDWRDPQVGIRVTRPSGHRFTEDAVSEGKEFEFTANPNKNWRIALNASQTKATRDKVPGESFLALSAFVDDKIMNTPAGEMPIFWSASPGVRINRYPTFRGDYLKLLALNGQLQPEVREWRANLITNYNFRDGRLKGFGIGGALKWEDSAAIDYLPSEDNAEVPDITSPVMDDGYETFDLWGSYRKKLNEKIDWRIQLNLYNVGGDDELVALSTDPFGNPNRWRIRQGMSWKISNTFEF